LQRIGRVLVDMDIQRGIGQAAAAARLLAGAVEAGQQQYRALLGDQRIVHRTAREPTYQLALPRIQGQADIAVEQAPAGIGVIAQALPDPVIIRHIQHQATAAPRTAAGVMGAGGYHDETLLHHLAATPFDFEVQRAGQAEHQLRMVVAVDNQIVAVVA
jgi:hypothetical protein